MIVLRQKPLRFKRSMRCRVHFPTLAKAMLWYNEKTNNNKPMLSSHTIFPRGEGCYPAVSIHGEKIMVHVLLVMYRLKGNIPETLVVHHQNEDKCDARGINLILMDYSEHSRKHNKGPDCSRWRGKRIEYASGIQVPLANILLSPLLHP